MNARDFQSDLLFWYQACGRDLPWRAPFGERGHPYHVWLSEIMLQQTTVATVKLYFNNFITKWPNVKALSEAPLDEILTEWAGLGYYARARNLHKCAQRIMQDYQGQFPSFQDDLLKLPGIGEYTAAAISSIAFHRHSIVVDGNVERIIARLFCIENPPKQDKRRIYERASSLTPSENTGDYAQAMMDLGALICRPKSPDCHHCPVQNHCRAYQEGKVSLYPKAKPKIPKPIRYAYFYIITNENDEFWLEKRPENSLLGGLMGFIGTAWEKKPINPTSGFGDIGDEKIKLEAELFSCLSEQLSISPLPCPTIKNKNKAQIFHVFTHFELRAKIVHVHCHKVSQQDALTNRLLKHSEGKWVKNRDFDVKSLPTLMRKIYNIIPILIKT